MSRWFHIPDFIFVNYYNDNEKFVAQWLRNMAASGYIGPGMVDERSIDEVRGDELSEYTRCHFFAGIGGWEVALRLAAEMSRKPGIERDSLGIACHLSGWPTPMAGSPATEEYNEAGNNDSSRKTVWLAAGWPSPRANKWGPSDSHGNTGMPDLAGWHTQKATDGSKGGPNQSGGSLPNDVSTAGWATPTVQSPNSLRGKGQDPLRRKEQGHTVNLQDQVFGTTPNGSTAGTESTGESLVLNPEFVRWLQGYPAGWGGFAATGTRSSRKSRRRS